LGRRERKREGKKSLSVKFPSGLKIRKFGAQLSILGKRVLQRETPQYSGGRVEKKE
jgi:hypothetical protein